MIAAGILDQITREIRGRMGTGLISVVLYGSAAGADFHPGVSDINLLLLVERITRLELEALRELVRRFRRVRLAVPLLLTPEDVRDSLDVFPIEFLEFKEKRKVLHGPDFLENTEIGLGNLRHECEHELRGRLIRLRQSFMEGRPTKAFLRGLLLSAHQSNVPAFRAALRLKRVSPPLGRDEIFSELSREFHLDHAVFARLQALRLDPKVTDRELLGLFERYGTEVEKLVQAVDQL